MRHLRDEVWEPWPFDHNNFAAWDKAGRCPEIPSQVPLKISEIELGTRGQDLLSGRRRLRSRSAMAGNRLLRLGLSNGNLIPRRVMPTREGLVGLEARVWGSTGRHDDEAPNRTSTGFAAVKTSSRCFQRARRAYKIQRGKRF